MNGPDLPDGVIILAADRPKLASDRMLAEMDGALAPAKAGARRPRSGNPGGPHYGVIHLSCFAMNNVGLDSAAPDSPL